MTVYTLQAPLPTLRLAAGMKLKLEAVHPTTGAAVAGVNVSHWAIFGSSPSLEESGEVLDTGPYMLVPGPAPLSNDPIVIRGGL